MPPTHYPRQFPLFVVLLLFSIAATAQPQRPTYPDTRRVDHVDVYHGTEVPDPYRWLEQDVRESDDVTQWVAAENRVTFAYLDAIPERESIRRRLTELWNFEKYQPPAMAGGRYFYLQNNGLQNQYILYRLDSLDGEPQVLLDPNTWSQDGTVALADFIPSPNGRYVAYGVAQSGSDWQTWQVIEVETGRILEDKIEWVKFSEANWTGDGKGFFYSRFNAPQEGAAYQSLNLNQKIYYHRLGSPQADDTLV